MIDVKTSTKAAAEFFNSVYPAPHNGVLLEEIELSDDEKYWLITLGYNVRVNPEDHTPLDLSALLGVKLRREYKTFKVDRETGDIKAMKIRKV